MNQPVDNTMQNPVSEDNSTVSEPPASPNPSPLNIGADDPAAPVDPSAAPSPDPEPVVPVTSTPEPAAPSPTPAIPKPVSPEPVVPVTSTPEPTAPSPAPAPVPSNTYDVPAENDSKSITVDSSQFEEPQDPMDKFDVTAQTEEEETAEPAI